MAFTVQAAAPDRSLLSIEELRAAAGIGGSDHDDALERIGLGLSDAIGRYCALSDDGQHPPTLLRETIVEVVRPSGRLAEIILARRFVAGDPAISIDGVLLPPEQVEVERGAGLLRRLSDERLVPWASGKLTITYQAGFAEIPADIKQAAMIAVREGWSALSRDPLLKSETVDGLGRADYWVGGSSGAQGEALPIATLALLSAYRSVWI